MVFGLCERTDKQTGLLITILRTPPVGEVSRTLHVQVCDCLVKIGVIVWQVDYEVISSTCNVFRALTDMYDSFYSVQSMIDYYARDNYNMSAYARPGAWNDPDQVTQP